MVFNFVFSELGTFINQLFPIDHLRIIVRTENTDNWGEPNGMVNEYKKRCYENARCEISPCPVGCAQNVDVISTHCLRSHYRRKGQRRGQRRGH